MSPAARTHPHHGDGRPAATRTPIHATEVAA
jgi:hypothetical protein